jgi:hypothetical protein
VIIFTAPYARASCSPTKPVPPAPAVTRTVRFCFPFHGAPVSRSAWRLVIPTRGSVPASVIDIVLGFRPTCSSLASAYLRNGKRCQCKETRRRKVEVREERERERERCEKKVNGGREGERVYVCMREREPGSVCVHVEWIGGVNWTYCAYDPISPPRAIQTSPRSAQISSPTCEGSARGTACQPWNVHMGIRICGCECMRVCGCLT